MSLIQNKSKGRYLFLTTKKDPASSAITLKSEIGTNAVVEPHHCRAVEDSRFKKNKHVYVVVVLKHHPGGQPMKWISQEIGPGQFWKFDGRKLYKDESRSTLDPNVCHGK